MPQCFTALLAALTGSVARIQTNGKEDATRTEHWTLKVDVEKLLWTSSAEPRSGACLLRQWVRVDVPSYHYLLH